jgi:hypothetical protein
MVLTSTGWHLKNFSSEDLNCELGILIKKRVKCHGPVTRIMRDVTRTRSRRCPDEQSWIIELRKRLHDQLNNTVWHAACTRTKII